MEKRRLSFRTIFVVNLAACYAPGLVWVNALPNPEGRPFQLLFSPVMLPLCFLETESFLADCLILAAFVVLVLSVSTCSLRTGLVNLWVVFFLFTLSLWQGLMALAFVSALDALGRS